MKKIILIGFILILIVLSIIFIIGTKNESYDAEIVSFEYSYGGYPGYIWEYKIYVKEGKTYFKALGMNGLDLNVDKEVNNSVLTDISMIIKENKIYKWNGFDKKSSIQDGNSFSLTIKYSDGKEVIAHGHEKYPSNYEQSHEILSNYLETIK